MATDNCCYSTDYAKAKVEFSWDGKDEFDDITQYRWAALQDDGTFRGLIILVGEELSFDPVPFDKE